MKKIYMLILTTLMVFNCSNEDDISSSDIVGEWKLMEANSYGPNPRTNYYTLQSKSYYLSNITYTFNLDGTLVVSGGDNVGMSNGVHEYVFEYDYLGYNSGPYIKLVNINGLKWTHDYNNGIMTLGRLYIDGDQLVFRRK